jgi:GT2 family glycosyltransferase
LLLSLVIPSLNTKGPLENMLSSLAMRPAEEAFEIIVVDMSSTDGTLPMLKSRFPEVTVLADVPNKGYGAAANAGMAKATGTHFLVCNSDLTFTEGAAEGIVKTLREVGDDTLAGFRLEGLNGVLQRSALRFPGPFDLIWMFSATVRSSWNLTFKLGRYLPDWSITQRTPVDWVIGAALAASRSLFERLGGFDEEFFLFCEEVDLCKRVHDLGATVIYEPGVTLIHIGGATLSDEDLRVRWIAAGKVRYTRKHYGHVVLLLARLGALVAYLASFPLWLVRRLRHHMTWADIGIQARRYGGALVEVWRA